MPPASASPVPPRLSPDASSTSAAPERRRSSPPHGTYVIHDPATDERVGVISAADEGACRDTVVRAVAASASWARTPATERAELLRRWAAALRDHVDEIARMLTRETGALPSDARSQVEAGVDAIERYAVLGPLQRTRRPVGALDDGEAIERVPRGVVAVLLPWRDPVALACAQVAASLAAGNVVVVKPSGRAPFAVEQAIRRLPAPPAVVSLLHGGAETGAWLASDLDVGMVLHSGSVEAGRMVAGACAKRLSAAITERGDTGAVIVDRDVDPAAAAAYAATAAFSHSGQLCGSIERVLVHRSRYDRFRAALLARIAPLGDGPGRSRGALAPLIDARQRATVHGQVMAAVAEGAQLVTGGTLPSGAGCFYPPTVLERVRPEMAVWSQKTFGPVAALMPFDEFDEAIALAAENAQRGALTVLTANATNAELATRELDAGAIDPNPFKGGASGVALDRLRRPGTGLGFGTELLDELTRWRVTRRRG